MKKLFVKIIAIAIIAMGAPSCTRYIYVDSQGNTGGWTCQPPASSGNCGGQPSSGNQQSSYDYDNYSSGNGMHDYGRGSDLVRSDFNTKPLSVNGDQFFWCTKLGGYIKGDPDSFCSQYNSYLSYSNTPKYQLKNTTVTIQGRQSTLYYFA